MPLSPAEQAVADTSTRNGWLLSAPALGILAFAAIGPLIIMLVYSFLTPGPSGNVEWQFSTKGWTGIVYAKDIFDDTYKLVDAHMTIFWRSIKLSVITTVLTFLVGFPTAWFIATQEPKARAFWLFLITIPFWTNLLIRTFAINEIIRGEGLLNGILLHLGLIGKPLVIIYTDFAVFANRREPLCDG